MTDILLLLIGAVLVNNFVLTQSLGVGPFMHASGRLETAVAMAATTTCVLTLSSPCTYLVHRYLLLPFDLAFLRTLAYVLIIAVIASLIGLAMQTAMPGWHRRLCSLLPLVAANSAVLGVALLNDNTSPGLVESVCYGFGAAAGFSLVLILFCALRERLAGSDVPAPFQGAGIALITAGLMSLAFMGFAGLV